MKKLFTIACLMLVTVLVLAQNTKKVAILEVVDREGKLSYNQKLILRSNMARAIANTDGYEAYDRSDVDMIMSEQNFQRTGLVSDDEIRKLGEMTGVSLILVTEGVLTGTNQIFVSAKILNVETGKVEMMDNLTMSLEINALQKGCSTLADHLLRTSSNITKTEKYHIARIGNNKYMYMGKSMSNQEYKMFLVSNCPKAYEQYQKGLRLIGAGWGTFWGGFALLGAGVTIWTIGNIFEDERGPVSIIAGGSAMVVGAGIPLLAVGYTKRNKAYKVYNNDCASSTVKPISFNVTSGQNGIGLAMQF